MIRKSLLLRIFDAAYIQRWNDKVRPMELAELDKQAHKMVIAYFLGKHEEETAGFDWIEIIEGGLFELLQRIVLTDLKPPIFYKIKEHPDQYRRLNEWVYRELEPFISPLGREFCEKFHDYFSRETGTINRRILGAAHFSATRWEFDIVERANPEGYEIQSIRRRLSDKLGEYGDLKGIAHLAGQRPAGEFIDLCGQLRFQIRWATFHRRPRTSVLGHSLFVALLMYFFSREIGACGRRLRNNYFTGLFHDLPEVLTRDIISPVKRSVEGLKDLIKAYEREEMEKEVYRLVPEEWHREIRLFTEDEFESVVAVGKDRITTTSDEISAKYNQDVFDPRDGQLVKAADDLAAFIEASAAIRHGNQSLELMEAKLSIRNRYAKNVLAGINLGEIYADFE